MHVFLNTQTHTFLPSRSEPRSLHEGSSRLRRGANVALISVAAERMAHKPGGEIHPQASFYDCQPQVAVTCLFSTFLLFFFIFYSPLVSLAGKEWVSFLVVLSPALGYVLIGSGSSQSSASLYILGFIICV